MLNRTFKLDLKNETDAPRVKAELANICNKYYYNYTPTSQTIKKHNILKKLKRNKNIVIMKPDKGNGVVVMDRDKYDTSLYKIINDGTKFKKLD